MMHGLNAFLNLRGGGVKLRILQGESSPSKSSGKNTGGVTTNDYCFISCYFISFKIKSNRYNLSVKYRIGYRYQQISVIKNRNIGISAFSHIGASLKIIISNLCPTLHRGISLD